MGTRRDAKKPTSAAKRAAFRRWQHKNPNYRREWNARNPERLAKYLATSRIDVFTKWGRAKTKARKRGEPIPEKPSRPIPERCEVCGNLPRRETLNYEHSHQTGKFRGWVCETCNSTLGHAKDNPQRLRALADYVERNS